jgi:hypothetical protein
MGGAFISDEKHVYRILVGKHLGKRSLENRDVRMI